jgi:hypothetical protein
MTKSHKKDEKAGKSERATRMSSFKTEIIAKNN